MVTKLLVHDHEFVYYKCDYLKNEKMAFVRITRGKTKEYQYFQLVENEWKNGKPKQKVLFHIGKALELPRHVIREYRISQENLKRIRSKYPTLRITN